MLFYYVAGAWNNEEWPHTGAAEPHLEDSATYRPLRLTSD